MLREPPLRDAAPTIIHPHATAPSTLLSMHAPMLRRPEEPDVAATPRRRPVCADAPLRRSSTLLAAQRRVVPTKRARGVGLGCRYGLHECGAGAPRLASN